MSRGGGGGGGGGGLGRASGSYLANEEDDDVRGYAWEDKFVGSWKNVVENEEGGLEVHRADEDEHLRRQQHEQYRRKLALGQSVRRGLIRYVYLAIDCSVGMREKDLKPDRLQHSLALAQEFVKEYFDQNPISQLGLLITRNQQAERLTDLSANPKTHIDQLKECSKKRMAEGESSLQNLLEMAMLSLRSIPDYGKREVVIISGSLSTCDPGDIFDTIKKLVKHRVRVSIISLAAEVYVCRKVAEETHGTYSIALDAKHYKDILMAQIAPPPVMANSKGPMYMDMVLMGFPSKKHSEVPSLAFDGTAEPKLKKVAFVCPRCENRVTDLPITCNVCNLPLVSSSHLARSYHHLFPVPQFTDMDPGEEAHKDHCHACLRHLDLASKNVVRLRCPNCHQAFCLDCDMYIHESLHNCPGCKNR